jgi:hypothetical protein
MAVADSVPTQLAASIRYNEWYAGRRGCHHKPMLSLEDVQYQSVVYFRDHGLAPAKGFGRTLPQPSEPDSGRPESVASGEISGRLEIFLPSGDARSALLSTT